MTLTVTFKVGADLDIAAVNVQNRVSIAQAKLPADVTRQGLTITKQSPRPGRDRRLDLARREPRRALPGNYATLQVVDVLARVPGVGQVTVFNGRDYGMRLWLNPDRLAGLGPHRRRCGRRGPRSRTCRPPPGRSASRRRRPASSSSTPSPRAGRLSTPAEFEDIILRTRADGSVLRVRDVARVELGAQSYGSFGPSRRHSRRRSSAIFQLPGANALDVSKGVQAAVARLAPSFPSGVDPYASRTTRREFVRVSIDEVVLTLLIAIGLVVLTVYVFLQDWRATLIPTMTIPVSLVGTFAVISAVRVLDQHADALRAGPGHRDRGRRRHRGGGEHPAASRRGRAGAREAAPARDGGGGGPGHRHRARADGGVHADRLPARHHRPALPAVRADHRGLGGAVRAERADPDPGALRAAAPARRRDPEALAGPDLERGLPPAHQWLRSDRAAHRPAIGPRGGSAAAPERRRLRPAPQSCPPGSRPPRTRAISWSTSSFPTPPRSSAPTRWCVRSRRSCSRRPASRPWWPSAGAASSPASTARTSPPSFRGSRPGRSGSAPSSRPPRSWAACARASASIQEAAIVVFPPPPIRGISSGGGFQFELQSVAGGSLQELDVTARKIMDAARQRPELAATFTAFRPGVPQLDAQVDRAKAKALGIPLSDVFRACRSSWARSTSTTSTRSGACIGCSSRPSRASAPRPSDVARLYVRSQPGDGAARWCR